MDAVNYEINIKNGITPFFYLLIFLLPFNSYPPNYLFLLALVLGAEISD